MRHTSSPESTRRTFSSAVYLVAMTGVLWAFQNCSKFESGRVGFQPTFDPPSSVSEGTPNDVPAGGGTTTPTATTPTTTTTPTPTTPTTTPTVAYSYVPRMILNARRNVTIPGCNAVNWVQIPNMPDYFVGRLRRDAPANDPNSCAGGEVYTLAWAKMNWATNTMELIGKMIDLNAVDATIQGKYRITTAYDPTIMHDGTDYWLAFECHGIGFVGTAAACMVPVRFTAPGGLDLSRGYVVVSGAPTDPASPTLTSASVPKLLRDDDGRVYLYWTAVKMRRDAPDVQNWISVTVQGTELVKDQAGRWVANGYGVELPADHPGNVEVMGLEDRPGMRKTADAYEIKKIGANYVLVGSVGDCTFPDDAVAGCYRMTMRKSTVPLGPRIFNEARVPDQQLPSNSIQYFHFVTRPADQKLMMAGWFANSYSSVNRMAPGYALMDAAADSNFLFPGSASIDGDPVATTVALTYRAILKRDPDPAGLRANVAALYAGLGTADLIKAFFGSAEGAMVYKTSLGARQFVANAWQEVLGHAPDDTSLDVWSGRVANGTVTRVDVLAWLTESDEFRLKNPAICPLYR